MAFPLIGAGSPQASVISGSAASDVEATAVSTFVAGVQRDGGLAIPVVYDLPSGSGPAVVIGTVAGNPLLNDLVTRFSLPVAQLGADGFLLRTLVDQGRSYLIIAGKDARGALYGAQEAIDQVVTGTAAGDVYVTQCDVRKAPSLTARGCYTLTCWGNAPRYDRAQWERTIDSMSAAGMNHIMFWMDGLFRSRRYPYAFMDQSYYAGVQLTDDDIHQLIQRAHARGMEFLFGSGVFGWIVAGEFAQRFPQAADTTGYNLCPSDPLAQQLTRDYLEEMIEVFPEADGYMLEIRDEYGDCMDSRCQTPLDPFGSRQYGQSELDFLSSLSQAVWARSPSAKFVWLIGYWNHSSDRLYYDRIRTMSRDPRLEWMEVRNRWTLPAMDGSYRPLTYFSNRASHWDPYYTLPPTSMQSVVQTTVNQGLYGYLPAYEPGFATASIYGDAVIPFPVDLIPYVLTQFYYREYTWNPGIDGTTLVDRAYRKFFTAEAPHGLTDDLLFLRDFNQAHYPVFTGVGLLGVLRSPSLAGAVDLVWGNPQLANKQYWLNRLADEVRSLQTLAAGGGDMVRIGQIEARIAAARPGASLRTKASLDLMQRAIDDIRNLLATDPDVPFIDYTLYHIDVRIAEYLGLPPPPSLFVVAYVEPGSPNATRDGPIYGPNGYHVEPAAVFGYAGRYDGSVCWMVSKFKLGNFLPAGTTALDIRSAMLCLPRTDVSWVGDPFTSIDLVLHHFAAQDQNTIASSDYHTVTPALTDFGIIIPRHTRNPDVQAAILVDVTSAIRDDLKNARSLSSFRIGADPAGDLSGLDITYFPTADNTDLAFGQLDHPEFRNVIKLLIRVGPPDCTSGSDADGDGVVDDCDLCPNTRPRVHVDATGCPPPVSADFDGDSDVDLSDFTGFQYCFNGPNRPPSDTTYCYVADLDQDGDVDLADFMVFQACFNGPNRPHAASCPY
jgi:hypothetical protein